MLSIRVQSNHVDTANQRRNIPAGVMGDGAIEEWSWRVNIADFEGGGRGH